MGQTGYKLFRVKANGDITSLFINKALPLPLDQWLEHENHPTKGFKERPGWHCCRVPNAPHLSNKGRAWYFVEMEGVNIEIRPEHQGGMWYLADRIKIISKVE